MENKEQTASGFRPRTTTEAEKSVSGTSEGKETQLEELENVESKSKASRKQHRVRNHCARFWLWWLIGVTVFLAIFLPLL